MLTYELGECDERKCTCLLRVPVPVKLLPDGHGTVLAVTTGANGTQEAGGVRGSQSV